MKLELPRRPGRPFYPLRALLHFAVGFVGVGLGTAAAVRYRALMSDWSFDLAFFHNLIASAARGEGFSQSASLHEIDGLTQLSHAFALLPALVPVYAVFGSLESLLVAQALGLALGAYPAARLARAAGGSERVAALAAAAYLSCYPLWRVGLADLRPLSLAIPALMWLAAALYERRTFEAALAALVACMVREEIPLMVAALAVGMWLLGRADRRGALAAINVAVGWFIVLMAAWPRVGYYVPFHDPAAIAQGMRLSLPEGVPASRPLGHLAGYLQPGAWPGILLEPWWAVAALPLVAYQLLISPYEWWHWSGSYIHHTAPLLGLAFAAGAVGWGRLDAFARGRWGGRPWGRWLAPGLVALAILTQLPGTRWGVMQAFGMLDGDQVVAEREARNRALREVIAHIPPEAAVATDYLLIARLSGRRHLYCYQSNFGSGGVDGSSGRPIPGLADVDHVLVDVEHGEMVEALSADPAFEWVMTGGGHHLYRRRAAGGG